MGSDTKIDISQDDRTHPLILYEPLAQRAIGLLDRGEIITKKEQAHHPAGRGREMERKRNGTL
ncbi:MAG: hypothetical protein Q8N09_06925 [Thermodesulfovibrionia bacterium]|nr:hypothetical protein [Thermodesulfovibrionia bacterium]